MTENLKALRHWLIKKLGGYTAQGACWPSTLSFPLLQVLGSLGVTRIEVNRQGVTSLSRDVETLRANGSKITFTAACPLLFQLQTGQIAVYFDRDAARPDVQAGSGDQA
jgi:hypothetical protein